MTPTLAGAMRTQLPRLDPGQDLASAMALLRSSGLGMLPVTRDGQLLGNVSLSTIAAAVRTRDAERATAPGRREREAT